MFPQINILNYKLGNFLPPKCNIIMYILNNFKKQHILTNKRRGDLFKQASQVVCSVVANHIYFSCV